jgi:transposase
MNTNKQIAMYRKALIKYSNRYTVTKAARRYKVTRQYIYYWKNRYDGSLKSLYDKSTRPHSHPTEHTSSELKLIKDMRRRNPKDGLVVFWVKLRQRGYNRHVSSLYRVMMRTNLKLYPKKKKKRKVKKYIQMTYPGERIQVDVKHVPTKCLVNELSGEKLYQYTAIDEFTRLRYLEIFDELSTYSSKQFLVNMVRYFPFKVKTVRTDNGIEFTNRLANTTNPQPTLFEQTLKELNIAHDYIKPYTPRHNGKVERSHRKDNERFYNVKTFYSIKDIRGEVKKYLRSYNNFPMAPLNWNSPKQFYVNYLTIDILSRFIF